MKIETSPCPDRNCWHGTVYAHDTYDGPCRKEDYLGCGEYRRIPCPICKGTSRVPSCPLQRIVFELDSA